MIGVDAKLEEFFHAYAAAFNSALQGKPMIETVKAAFADCCIGASPRGVRCANIDEFEAGLTQGYNFYRSIGVDTMSITSIMVTTLDDLHVLARVAWQAGFTRRDGHTGQIPFENIYLVQLIDDQPKIFAYITPDETRILEEWGLLTHEQVKELEQQAAEQ